jgi:hypothetical protein
MLISEFNKLPLAERSKMVFDKGKLIGIFQEHDLKKAFFYKLNDLKIDVIYDKTLNRLSDIGAWETSSDRAIFHRMLLK